jgi:hypothetical protein
VQVPGYIIVALNEYFKKVSWYDWVIHNYLYPGAYYFS